MERYRKQWPSRISSLRYQCFWTSLSGGPPVRLSCTSLVPRLIIHTVERKLIGTAVFYQYKMILAGEAFLYSSGKMYELGDLGGRFSFASGINDLGQIVGTSTISDGAAHAFIYAAGKMLDLNSLVSADQFASVNLKVLAEARGINNRGQIVGVATDAKGADLAFLLTPVGMSAEVDVTALRNYNKHVAAQNPSANITVAASTSETTPSHPATIISSGATTAPDPNIITKHPEGLRFANGPPNSLELVTTEAERALEATPGDALELKGLSMFGLATTVTLAPDGSFIMQDDPRQRITYM